MNMHWAYIAGFIDGEGTIGLMKRKNKSSIEYAVRITNKDKYTLEKILEFFNENNIHGSISQQSKKPIRDGWSIIYVIQIGSREGVKKIIENTLPYLITKKERAKIMLKFFEIRKRKTRIHNQIEWKLYVQMCMLNDGKGKSIINELNERNNLRIN